jgi:hypothetical protein
MGFQLSSIFGASGFPAATIEAESSPAHENYINVIGNIYRTI